MLNTNLAISNIVLTQQILLKEKILFRFDAINDSRLYFL